MYDHQKNEVTQVAKIDEEIRELKARLLAAYRSPQYQKSRKPELAKKNRKMPGMTRRLGWKEDSLGYRSCKIDPLMWGRKNSEYGNLSCWILVCGWELHLIKINAGNDQVWIVAAHATGKKVIHRKVRMPRGTADAKALNAMLRERLKITFKV